MFETESHLITHVFSKHQTVKFGMGIHGRHGSVRWTVRMFDELAGPENERVNGFVLFSIFPDRFRKRRFQKEMGKDYPFGNHPPDAGLFRTGHQPAPVKAIIFPEELGYIVEPEQPEPGMVSTVDAQQQESMLKRKGR